MFRNALEEAIITSLRTKADQSAFTLCKSVQGTPKAIVSQLDLLMREGLITSRKVAGIETYNLAPELLMDDPEEEPDKAFKTPPTTPAIASEEVTTVTTQTPVAVAPRVTPESNPGHSKPEEKTSKHVGVCFIKQSHKWRAYIQHHGRPVRIGLYRTETEAVAARAEYIAKNPGAGKSGRPGPKPALKEIVEMATDATPLDSLVEKIVDRMIVAELRRRLQ